MRVDDGRVGPWIVGMPCSQCTHDNQSLNFIVVKNVEKRIVPFIVLKYVVDDETVWFSLSFSLEALYS